MKAMQTSQPHIIHESPEKISDVLFAALSFVLWMGFVLLLLSPPRI